MHRENLHQLLPILPALAVLALAGAGWALFDRLSRLRRSRRESGHIERYWLEEVAHQARMKATSFLRPSRHKRLTYQPPSASDEIAPGTMARYAPAMQDDLSSRLARARFRAWHRGTREADFMIGGFFDSHSGDWGDAELAWFEDLLEEDDVDVMAWALKTAQAPEKYAGDQLLALQKLDYVTI